MSLFVLFIMELNVQLFTSQVSKDQLCVCGFALSGCACIATSGCAFSFFVCVLIKDQIPK